MSQAWIPAVGERTVVRKERRLPLPGEIHVKIGDIVTPDTIVASARVPHIHEVKAAETLGVDPEEVEQYMVKKVEEEVTIDEIIAVRHRSFFSKEKVYRSPFNGVIRGIYKGRILIQELHQLKVESYIPGTVVETLADEGVVVETTAMLIQGVFGVGGETHGKLKAVANTSNDILTEKDINSNCRGKILVGGSLVMLEALHKAVATGVKGIIVGGIEEKDLVDFLGYEIGMPTTGNQDIGITLILTEGFGRIPMNDKTFRLLQSYSGRQASMNGATQIRLGAIRP